MEPRHPCYQSTRHLPTRWLMTDERMADGLWRALARLPRGGGVVFRHYSLLPRERRRLFARVRRVALRRGLVLVRAGQMRMPGEVGTHARRGSGLVTWPVHDIGEARAARRVGADAVFVSPVFATRSHPGAAGLGERRARVIGRAAGVPIIALGGVSDARFRRLRGFHGYAAIDAWLA
ncbi:thiamine phosphate synthase [Sphingomonas sp.]|uniref:thiamine phosphate synthase n=1 Tax=Sphingomonas sp. TaxID=28214 RepID=UPI0035C845B2